MAAIMVQGCTSGAGKSYLTAALCAALRADGYRVAPFKAQNMSNNAAVTAGGGEIGRAQYVQAIAAGVEPDVRMNPILLKPEADDRSQVVVLGRVDPAASAMPWRERSAALWPTARAALRQLLAEYDVVVCEGAGSPAEVNLASSDYVNMALAREADAPVLLVADIDRGGAFAHLLGTWACLSSADQARIAGFVLNRFRGDPDLLAPGPQWLQERTGIPTVGVVPMLDIALPEEDGAGAPGAGRASDGAPPPAATALAADTGWVAVIALPRAANIDEFLPLGALVRPAREPADLDGASAIVLPGSKSVLADLRWLRETGLAGAITRAADRGAIVHGICGGLQMLGRALRDPDGVEAARAGDATGLGLLDIDTTWSAEKTTRRIEVRDPDGGQLLGGYEIHHGATTGGAGATETIPGLAWRSGNVSGTYLHGLWENPGYLARFARRAGLPVPAALDDLPARLESLGHAVRGHLDWGAVTELVRRGPGRMAGARRG
jgi:adenosylcobyric acid synthase